MNKLEKVSHNSSSVFAQGVEENLNAKSLSFAALPGGQVHVGNPTWFMSGLNRAGYNGVTSATFDPRRVDEQIEGTLEPFRQSATPLTWWVGPASEPRNLGRALQGHGFTHLRDMMGMAANLDQLEPLPHPLVDFSFEPVNDRTGLEAWMPVFMEVFGMPFSDMPEVMDIFARLSFAPDSEWRHYALRDKGGRVVSTSSLHLGGGVAGLYNVATLEAYRQHGLGTAITWLTYAQARQEGYQVGTLQTTYPNALRLYHRMGFEVYCKFGVYQRSW